MAGRCSGDRGHLETLLSVFMGEVCTNDGGIRVEILDDMGLNWLLYEQTFPVDLFRWP